MRLLLTRAVLDAARTQEKLEALGHNAVICPVIEIVGTGASWPPGVVDAVLATSGHAFATRLDGLAPEAKRLLPLFLVGTRTAETAAAQGFLGASRIAKTAAALAADIEKISTDRLGRVLYLAGRDRKPDLEAAFEAIGREPEIIEVYKAVSVDAPSPEAVRAFRQNTIDGILHFSRRSTSLFLTMASSHGFNIGTLAHFCLSEDVAGPLREASFTEIHVAPDPIESGLLALLPAAEGANIENGA